MAEPSYKNLIAEVAASFQNNEVATQFEKKFSTLGEQVLTPEIGIGKFNQELFAEIQKSVVLLDKDPDNQEARTAVLTGQVELTKQHLNITQEQSANLVRSTIAAKVAEKGYEPKEILALLTKDQQRILNFAEDPQRVYGIDLITANKIAIAVGGLSGVLLTASLVLFIFALFSLGTVAMAQIGIAGGLLTTLQQLTKSKLLYAAGGTFLLSQALGHFSNTITMSTNQIIDNGSIAPGLRIQAITDVEKLKAKAGLPSIFTASGDGTFGERGPVTRISTQKTAKPKTYIGTILGGRIAEAKEFVRQLDDEITDEKDLLKDAQINMVNWLASLPGKITYEVQVKFNPFDEFQVRKVGYWVTLALYVNNNLNKRLFVDEILLGPIDPIRYYPESTVSKTVQMEIPKQLTPTEIKTLQTDMGEMITIDETGNMVRTFSDEQKSQGASERQNIAVLEKVVADLKQKITEEQTKKAPAPTPIPPAPASTPTSLPTPPQPAPVVAPTFTPTTSAPVSYSPPPPPPPPPPAPTPSDPWAVGETAFVNTPGTILNIRDGASVNARDMGDLPHRMQVTILSQPEYKDGYSWIVVRTSAGQTGYVAREYLVKN